MAPVCGSISAKCWKVPRFVAAGRCQQFLQHIVEKAIGSHYDELKERTLGVELFGRSPTYDTGEDAIVRVTASDVRKRLHQFYSETSTSLRIEIPSGSYGPEFRRVAAPAAVPSPSTPPPVPAHAQEPEPLVARLKPPGRKLRSAIRYSICAALALALLPGVWLWNKHDRLSPRNVLPWSDLFRHDRPVQLIFADPDISTIQELLGFQISLSEYANRQYVRETEPVGPDLRRALRSLRGVNVAMVDAGIALNISGLAGASAARLRIHPARTLQLGDIKTDDDFIFLGSPHSNPWATLFEDQMDFDFVYDANIRHRGHSGQTSAQGRTQRLCAYCRGWGHGPGVCRDGVRRQSPVKMAMCCCWPAPMPKEPRRRANSPVTSTCSRVASGSVASIRRGPAGSLRTVTGSPHHGWFSEHLRGHCLPPDSVPADTLTAGFQRSYRFGPSAQVNQGDFSCLPER